MNPTVLLILPLPIDNLQFALDPDGAWYDEAVTGDVMDQDGGDERENAPSPAKKKSTFEVGYRYVWPCSMLILGLI